LTISRNRALFGGLAFFFLFFLIAPVLTVFVRALSATGTGGPGAMWRTLVDIVSSPRTRSVITFTVGQAALSAAIAVVVALPGAYLISHYSFPGRRFIYSLSLIPFILPSIIVVVAMIGFYGKSGLINRVLGTDYNLVYNFQGIILAHVFYNFSLAIRVIATAWAGIDRRFREGGESLGDSPSGILFRITLPLLAPAILTSFVLVFVYCFLSFGIVLVFGGVRFATFEVAIFREMFVNLDLPAAAVFSLLQLLFSGFFIALSSRSLSQSRAGIIDPRIVLPPLRSVGPIPRLLAVVYLTAMIAFVLGPLTTMIFRAFTAADGTIGLENFQQLLVPGPGERNVASILRSSVPRRHSSQPDHRRRERHLHLSRRGSDCSQSPGQLPGVAGQCAPDPARRLPGDRRSRDAAPLAGCPATGGTDRAGAVLRRLSPRLPDHPFRRRRAQ
jgi:thiamine transport system permease protein